MNLPAACSYEQQAIDIVVQVINGANFALGKRLNLDDLANTRQTIAAKSKIAMSQLRNPLVVNSKRVIRELIERQWKLDAFLYCLKPHDSNRDEAFSYYFYEAIFSQPTPEYPIPQVTASVFFTIKESHTGDNMLPRLTFRLEGHHMEYDCRHTSVTEDWIARIIAMKMETFKRFLNLNF